MPFLMPLYIPLMFPLMAAERQDVLAEFCPVFVCAAPSSLLSLAPGNPENL